MFFETKKPLWVGHGAVVGSFKEMATKLEVAEAMSGA